MADLIESPAPMTAPEMTPAQHAAAILSWAKGLDAHAVASTLADAAHPAWAHAAALSVAADATDEATRSAGLGALFGGLVEPLNDGFTVAGRAVYAALFPRICWLALERQVTVRARLASCGILDESALIARFHHLRKGSTPAPREARSIAILSRVTVGADIALTTVAIQRLRQKYPEATITVLGDAKLAGLFGFPGVTVAPIAYGRRGGLGDRLAAWLPVMDALDAIAPDLVVQPDSRLTQLGILPIGDANRPTWLWENLLSETKPTNPQDDGLAGVLDRALNDWLFGSALKKPVVPRLQFTPDFASLAQVFAAAVGTAPMVAVKLDHGGNPKKSLPREGEIQLLRHLRHQGWRILLDRGFGATELASSDELVAAAGLDVVDVDDSGKGLGANVHALETGALRSAGAIRFHGSIAGWGAAVAACKLAVSYDSVGHHLAAALGVPVVTAFTGHEHPRFVEAWRPTGPGAVTLIDIPTAERDQPAHWQRLFAALPAPG